MRGRFSKVMAGLLLACVCAGLTGLTAQEASAQEPPHQYAKYPIILGSGFAEPAVYMEPLALRLAESGIYDVYIWDNPVFGLSGLADAAGSLKSKVEEVRAKYNGRRVDMVTIGTSGVVARQYIQALGGGDAIDDLVMLAPPNKGSQLADLAATVSLGTCFFIPACKDLETSSAFITQLNAPGVNLGDVTYTNIATVYEQTVLPYTNSFMDQTGKVKNVTLQDQCPAILLANLGLGISGVIYTGVEDALAKRNIEFDCGAL